jgi:DeoR/GlpR family transcriptional regulator of sugar metabolism
MKTDDRHRAIADVLRKQNVATVDELVERCAASAATIRRDLETLAGHGVLRRIHGGAQSLLGQGGNAGYGQRELEDRAVKKRIAVAVAKLLRDGEHVWLDSGSTATEVARAVAGKDLTLMPMSLQSLTAATGNGDTAGVRPALLLPGGKLMPGELSFRGPLAEANIRSLRFDTAVITPCAVDFAAGLLAHDLEDAAIKRAGIDSAARVVLVASAAKWHTQARALVAGLPQVDVMVTDKELSAGEQAKLDEYSVEVVKA